MEEILNGINHFMNSKKEEVYITSFDGYNLKGYYLKNTNSINKTIILAHGYHSAPFFDFSIGHLEYMRLGFDLLFIEERAHEHSEGKFTTFGMKERYDIKSWVSFVADRYPDNDIVLAGVSMGAASTLFALGLELKDNVKCAILDCPFSNAFDEILWTVSKKRKWYVKIFINMINLYMKIFEGVSLKDTNASEVLKKNALPIFIAHGVIDKVVPIEMADEIYEKARGIKEYVKVENAPHAQSFIKAKDEYTSKLEAFLKKVL